MNIQDLYDQYDEMLDEQGDVELCGMTYSASQTLKAVDPIAYDCGFNDYCDSIEVDTDEMED